MGQDIEALKEINNALMTQLTAAETEIERLKAQCTELKNQRDALNEQLALERENRFQLLTRRRNWLQSVVLTVLRSLGFIKGKG